MKVKREIASLPARTGQETWDAVIELITGPDSVERGQLTAAASIIASAIADEHAAKVPIVVKGVGPRLVIYTVHGADAMELGSKIDALTWNPTGGLAWCIAVPCAKEDVTWMSGALQTRAPRITVYDSNIEPAEESKNGAQAGSDVVINWGALDKP